MTNPKVSIIATCYNHASFLPEFLDSVASQSFGDFELVIGDDASDDGSVELLKKAARTDSRIRVMTHAINQGFSKNFNRLLAAVRGEYVALISCDDVMLSRKLEEQVAALDSDSSAVACLHWVEVFENDTGQKLHCIDDQEILRCPSDWFLNLPILERRKHAAYPPAAVMWQRHYIEGMCYDARLPHKNEILFAIDCHQRNPMGKWICVPKVLSKYRRHGFNMSASAAMNSAIFDETKLLAALVAERYPRLGSHYRKVLVDLLVRGLIYGWIPKNREKEWESELRSEVSSVAYYVFWLMKHSPGRGRRILGRLLGTLI
jgi:glycosyltransferase involved in cell wall biosynthesis